MRRSILIGIFLFGLAMVGGLTLWAGQETPASSPALPLKIDFNRDIRPILSDNCFFCHGPDKNKRKADLRLDTREGQLAELGKGRLAIVPGHPQKSEVYLRAVSTDPDEQMPPPDSSKPRLNEHQAALLKTWIEQGAEYKGHWLYEPIGAPQPPKVGPSPFVRNDIDRFILKRLQDEGLTPSPEADRRTLIRRVYLDLIGLPPSPMEVDAFVSDSRPDAFERIVDRLLASPAYGERLAMVWLDLVRFADTVGYHGDRPMSIYPYRDYVIEALNQNRRFTVEQLAGDLLPNAALEQKIAAGYNRLNMMSEEGGIQDKEYLARYAADRVRNFSAVWFGSTMGCAECHDHKYDPFSTKDFYSMQAFFADITEVGYYGGRNVDDKWGEHIQVPSERQAQQMRHLDAEIAQLRQTLNAPSAELDTAQARWEQISRTKTWTALKLVEARSQQGSMFKPLDNGSILAVGPSPDKDTYLITFTTSLKNITAFRLEVLPDPSLPGQGPGRFQNGNFILNELELQVNDVKVPLTDPSATFEQQGYTVASAIDNNPAGGWAISPQMGKAHDAIFQTAADVGDGSETRLTFILRQLVGKQNTIGRFRLTATTGQRPNTVHDLPQNIAEILAVDPAQRNPDQKAAIASHFRSIVPQLKDVRDRIAAVEQQKKQLNASIPTTLATVARDEPRMIRVLPRGNWMDESGAVVQPTVPHFLKQINKQGRATRLDLAQWVVSPENPLTGRVMANRLWKLAFGYGLSRNMQDLGSQGEWPTHPELLDYLAGRFARSWDIKQTLRLIFTSAAYRQSSATTPQMRERDPYNRLLARQNRFRLDAELIRDNALTVSGLVMHKLGGPSAKPYQPAGYYAYLNFPPREYQPDTDAGLYRRGVYTWWQRQYLHPSLLAFDAPSREECAADRPRSNTPLQALVLLNDPSYVEAARVFAQRILLEGGKTSQDRLQWAYRAALGRGVADKELAALAPLLQKHLLEYRENPSDADPLLAIGQSMPPPTLDRAELAAWTSIARIILNLNETISRD